VTGRHGQYFAGAPCTLRCSASSGRHLVARQELPQSTAVLTSEAYLTALLPSHRKRICACCRTDAGRRMTIHCAGCGQAYYCSEDCRDRHAAGLAPSTGLLEQPGLGRSVPAIPHAVVCPVLCHTGAAKADADMECILHMLVDVLALKHLESGGVNCGRSQIFLGGAADLNGGMANRNGSTSNRNDGSAIPAEHGCGSGWSRDGVKGCSGREESQLSAANMSSHAQLPQQGQEQQQGGHCHGDFELLQFHPDSMSQRDLQEWRRALRHLRTALERAQWPQPAPPEAVLLSWVGRIAANSFGLHVLPPAPILGVQPPSAAECAAAHDSEAERAAARLSALQLRQRRLWESPDAAIDMAGGPDSANHPDAGSPTEISTSQESVPPPPCHGPICAGATVNPRVNRTHNRSPPCAGGTPTPGVCQAAAPRPHQAATGSQSRDAAGVAETLPPKQPSLEHSRPASSGGSAQQPQHPVQEDSQMPPASDPPVQPTRSEGAAAPLEVSEAVPMLQALPKPEVPSSELPSAPIAPAVGAVTTAAGSSGLQLGAQETQSPSCTSAKPAADVSLGGLAQYLGANAAPTAADTAPSQSDQRLTDKVPGEPKQLSTADHTTATAGGAAVGRELFIAASYFNHSCEPNCIIRRRGAFGFVSTLRAVEAGEELCISYIDLEPPRSARRAELLKCFHFHCQCTRCEREAVAGSGKSSYAQKSAAAIKGGAPKRRGRKARISR